MNSLETLINTMVSSKVAGPLFRMMIQMQQHLEREPQQEDVVNHLELEKAFVRLFTSDFSIYLSLSNVRLMKKKTYVQQTSFSD